MRKAFGDLRMEVCTANLQVLGIVCQGFTALGFYNDLAGHLGQYGVVGPRKGIHP